MLKIMVKKEMIGKASMLVKLWCTHILAALFPHVYTKVDKFEYKG